MRWFNHHDLSSRKEELMSVLSGGPVLASTLSGMFGPGYLQLIRSIPASGPIIRKKRVHGSVLYYIEDNIEH